MPKVYVVNKTTHDYSVAGRFGEVVYITEGKVPIFKTDEVVTLVHKALVDFTDKDYILVAGPSILSIIVSTAAFSRCSTVKFLIFDAKIQAYIVRHINKNNLSL